MASRADVECCATLFSGSGKVQYFCPKCDSPKVMGPITILGQKAVVCFPCNAWFQWSSRIKRSCQ